jgi:hypothetical protein
MIECRRCNETVQVRDDLAQVQCPRCGNALAPVETHITATAPPPSQAYHSQAPADWSPTAANHAPPPLPDKYADWDEFRELSPTLQGERIRLATVPLPDMRNVELWTLPDNLPAKTDEFGQPLATLSVAGESKSMNRSIGTFIAVVGCFLLIFLGFNYGTARVDPGHGRGISPGAIVSLIAIVGISFGVWFAFFRQPRLHVLVWIFENGLFLQRGSDVEACGWEDVKEMRVNHEYGRPTFLLVTRGNCRIVLSPDQTATMMPLAEYIKVKITSAQLLPKLRRIFEGERIKFGAVYLDREGLTCSFHAPWSNVARVVLDDANLFIDCRDRTEWHAIPLRDVSFPLLVLAISHVLIEEGQRLPSLDDAETAVPSRETASE